ncbi:hypothetical protein RYA05_00715 [Pseudomonas syringae pv. actinidiae]|nr:hypothetical protein [Pseudomonas syringae pv. actinidiae]
MRIKFQALGLAAVILSGCSAYNPVYVTDRQSYQYSQINEGPPIVEASSPDVYVPPVDASYNPQDPALASTEQTGTYYASSSDIDTSAVDHDNPIETAPTEQPANDSGYQQTPQTQLSGGQDLLDKAIEAKKNQEVGSMIMYLEEAAQQGNGQAYYLLAKYYTKGDLVPKNTDLADVYLNQADSLGYAEATRVLAWKNLLGHQADANYADGKQMMERAAQTSTRAKRDLGMLYGNFYKPNLNDSGLAQLYLQQAFGEGDAEAAYYLHQILSKTRTDDIMSENALDYAAQAGQPKALLEIGKAKLSTGDKAGAKDSLLRAAQTGDAEAMYLYANAVSIGKIPSSDKDRDAYLWFKLAADANYPGAQDEMKALDGIRKQDEKHNAGALKAKIEEQRSSLQIWNPNKES